MLREEQALQRSLTRRLLYNYFIIYTLRSILCASPPHSPPALCSILYTIFFFLIHVLLYTLYVMLYSFLNTCYTL